MATLMVGTNAFRKLAEDAIRRGIESERTWQRSITSYPKINTVWSSASTTHLNHGPSEKSMTSEGFIQTQVQDSAYSAVNGSQSMSEQKITLALGGKFGFTVTKTFGDDTERFTVGVGDGRYGSEITISDGSPWQEAMNALNKFREEAAEAAEALVQVSTMTAVGSQEDE